MRHSVTNLFIVNLAVSDLLILVVGVPDIVQFMLNRGWLLGDVLCRLDRYVLVFCLYASVLSLVAVCIERYVAIIHPMTAHIYCSRGRIQTVIAIIWPCVLVLALPIALFNTLVAPSPHFAQRFCVLRFPGRHLHYFVPYKYAEFALFYLLPVVIQVGCYTIITRRLFASTKQLRAPSGGSRDLAKQRKGVVKMLIACVAIYVVSYSPHQVLLFYRTFSPGPIQHSWTFLVFVTAMAYVNSATNPVIYCVFSAAYRAKFRAIFCFVWRGRASEGGGSVAASQTGERTDRRT
ncbi:Neuropeptide receptor 15, partial [Lamellibrachia satsuma]